MKNEVNFNEQIRHVVEGKEELSPAARHSMRWHQCTRKWYSICYEQKFQFISRKLCFMNIDYQAFYIKILKVGALSKYSITVSKLIAKVQLQHKQHSVIIAQNSNCCRQMRILLNKSFHSVSTGYKQARSGGAVLMLTVNYSQ